MYGDNLKQKKKKKKEGNSQFGHFHLINARVQFKNIIGDQNIAKMKRKKKSTFVKLPCCAGYHCVFISWEKSWFMVRYLKSLDLEFGGLKNLLFSMSRTRLCDNKSYIMPILKNKAFLGGTRKRFSISAYYLSKKFSGPAPVCTMAAMACLWCSQEKFWE